MGYVKNSDGQIEYVVIHSGWDMYDHYLAWDNWGSDTHLDTANLVMERILKIAQVDEETEEVLSYREKLEVGQYGIDDLKTLIDTRKQEIVAEMARHDPEVLERVVVMLTSDNYTRRMDALWIISRVVPYLGPTRAYPFGCHHVKVHGFQRH